MYEAYADGRASTDPSVEWYKGGIKFFDNHVIPLAKMIKACGVFAGSNDESLTHAVQNRKEWEERGQAICRDMLTKANATQNPEVV